MMVTYWHAWHDESWRNVDEWFISYTRYWPRIDPECNECEWLVPGTFDCDGNSNKWIE